MGCWSLYKLLEADVFFIKLLPRQLGFTRKKGGIWPISFSLYLLWAIV